MSSAIDPRPSSHRAPTAQVEELAARWRLARRAACLAVTGAAAASLDDDALVRLALTLDAARTLRGLYDNGLRLGHGYASFHRGRATLDELPALLGALGVPCLGGTWRSPPGVPAHFLERPGCPDAGTCDAWREAIDGLVVGLSGAHHARHRSRGHGDRTCIDVLFADPRSPLRFGPIPGPIAPVLEQVRQCVRRFNSTAEVTFLGLSEGELFYEVQHGSKGPSNVDVGELLRREVRRRLPEVSLREAGSRAVLETT